MERITSKKNRYYFAEDEQKKKDFWYSMLMLVLGTAVLAGAYGLAKLVEYYFG